MKIVIVSNYTLGGEMGTAKVSEELSSRMSQKHEVLYLCLGNKYKFQKLQDGLSCLKIPSIPVRQGYIPKLSPENVSQIFEDLASFSPDVIHAQNIVFVSLICLIWATKKGVPFIITFHSLPSEGISYMFPKLSKNKVLKIINYSLTSGYINRFLGEADLIIALNRYIEKSIRSIRPTVPIKRIHNGIPLDIYYTLKIKKPEQRKEFIYLGAYMSRKNQEFLIKIFKFLPNNYYLNLYGNIKTGRGYVNKLRKIIKENKVQNVRINGFLDRKEVCCALEKADYLISASVKEVQSLVIIEALASGTPVIGIKNETINEIIDGKNGLSVPKNISPSVFAKKVIKYVKNSEASYVKTANYCRESVKRFDLDNIATDLINTYQKIIVLKRKRSQKKSQFLRLVPKQLEKFFTQVFSEPKPQKTLPLKILLNLTILVSAISSPVLESASFIKSRAARLSKQLKF